MKKLTRQDVEKKALRTEPFKVPSWGGAIEIRPMTGREGQEFQRRAVSGEFDDAAIEQMADVVHRCTVDPVFESVDEVLEMPVAGIQPIFEEVLKLSGFDKDAVDEAEGNSETTPASSSSTS